MKTFINCVVALLTLLWGSAGIAAETRVIINLSNQSVSLIEGDRTILVSPIASGKPGWSTPTGNFSIFNKDIDHLSRSFGLIVDAYGRVVNPNATPNTYVSRGDHYQPAPMPYFMEFSSAIGMHADTFQDTLRPTDAYGCPEIPLPCFFSGSELARQSRSSAQRTI